MVEEGRTAYRVITPIGKSFTALEKFLADFLVFVANNPKDSAHRLETSKNEKVKQVRSFYSSSLFSSSSNSSSFSDFFFFFSLGFRA